MAEADFANIRKALEDQLKSVLDDSPAIPISWENVDYSDTAEVPKWVRAAIDVVDQKPSAVGVNSQIKHEGIFLVDCFVKSQTGEAGPDAADRLAQRIQDSFRYGQYLEANGVRVYIRSAKRSGGRIDSPWYFVPVAIFFYSYI